MLEQLRFYFRHSLNDLRVNGRRSFYALLCIAAGVAAIVGLQTLAVMAGDTLTGSVQESNRGDIRLSTDLATGEESRNLVKQGVDEGVLVETSNSLFGTAINQVLITENGLKALRDWMDTNYPGQLADSTYLQDVAGFTGVIVSKSDGGTQAPFVAPLVIDPKKYPLYGKVVLEDGRGLAEALTGPTDIVISRTLANKVGAGVGDTVKLSVANADFTVRGIAPDNSEGGFENIMFGLFGYSYLDMSAVQTFKRDPAARVVYLKLADPSRTAEIGQAIEERFPYLRPTTTDDLREINAAAATALNQLVTVMGLVSLLIGGIGIVNTMQVVVRRRTVEVAVLKTIGLQANQVTILFLVEAFLLGFIGSLLGIVFGWLLTFLIKGVAETFVAQSLTFRITPGPAINGLIVGTLVTTIFGFLPTLSAGQVRPGVVLRPNDAVVFRAGLGRSLLALLIVILALSLVAMPILGSFTTALIAILGAFAVAGFLYFWLWVMIWVVGKFFPNLGLVDLKVALRSMLATRRRSAITLLALVIGVFSLSLITLFAGSINQLFESLLVQQSGGNVFVFTAGTGVLDQVKETLAGLPGVKSSATTASYTVGLQTVETTDGQKLDTAALNQRVKEAIDSGRVVVMGGGRAEETDYVGIVFGSVVAREVDSNLPQKSMLAGRNLTPEDAGKPVIVIPGGGALVGMGVQIGDKMTFRIQRTGLGGLFGGSAPEFTFEVVGIFNSQGINASPEDTYPYAPYDAFPANVQPDRVTAIVDVEEAHIPALQQAFAKIPGTFVLETKFLNNVLNSLINQFTTFPILVAALGLLVGGIVIANSVVLTTMERRREIAIMKSVGLQRERVLGMLLLENVLMGIIGGLIGVGIGLLGLIMLQATMMANMPEGMSINIVPYGTGLLLMGLCVLVAVLAALATAWGASGEKPLIVLRYD